jgi:hypothetical protein
MLQRIFSGVLWLGAAFMIVVTGWNQPLRYQFMSKSDIEQENAPPPPPPRVQMSNWQPIGTALDRAPYTRRNDGVHYTRNIDSMKMGTSTETSSRPNLRVSGAGNSSLDQPAHR